MFHKLPGMLCLLGTEPTSNAHSTEQGSHHQMLLCTVEHEDQLRLELFFTVSPAHLPAKQPVFTVGSHHWWSEIRSTEGVGMPGREE